METAASSQIPVVAPAKAREAGGSLPWYCLAAVLGATCIPIGALWDISWHSTIGRDTFWTPAHIMIHLGGLVPGFTAGWLAWRSTFGPAELREGAVRLWALRAPLGAWVIIWGAMAMLLSAPFDNWWHNAYGLDVEILSPPHTVLAAGMYAVAIGALLLVLSWQNRVGSLAGSRLFVYAAGILLTMSTIIVTEKSYPNHQHGTAFYIFSSAIYPLYLVGAARASRMRWSATGAALVYMAFYGAMIWILPLFEARPMLAPIYNPVDRMVPPNFPLLLVVPAVVIDLAMMAFAGKRGFWWDNLRAMVLGALFLGIFFVVQYHFAEFLISPGADNWFFAGNRSWPYWIKLGDFRFRFWEQDIDPIRWGGMWIALAFAVFVSRLGLAAGNWMSKVQR